MLHWGVTTWSGPVHRSSRKCSPKKKEIRKFTVAPYVTKPSVAMALTVLDKQIIVFSEEWFQLPVHCPSREMIENVDIINVYSVQKNEVHNRLTYSLYTFPELRHIHRRMESWEKRWTISRPTIDPSSANFRNFSPSLTRSRRHRPHKLAPALWWVWLHKMAAVLQATFSNAFSWMKIFVFWLKFNWNLFLKVQFTISQHWFS